MYDYRWPGHWRAAFYGLRLLTVIAITAPFWNFASVCFGTPPKPTYSSYDGYYQDPAYYQPPGYSTRSRSWVDEGEESRGLLAQAFPKLARCGRSFPSVLAILGGVLSAAAVDWVWRRARREVDYRL